MMRDHVKLRLLHLSDCFWRWWGPPTVLVFRLRVLMKPLIIGRCFLYEYLVRKGPEIVLTVVCKTSVVPVLPNAPSGSFNLRLRLFGPANQADIVSVVFRKEFLGDGSFTALMVERTWRHIGTEAFCLVVLPHLVFDVFDYQDPVLLATMFDMSREPHPASSSAVVLLLFDAQRDLRLQSFYPLLELWSGRSTFQKLLPVTAEAQWRLQRQRQQSEQKVQ